MRMPRISQQELKGFGQVYVIRHTCPVSGPPSQAFWGQTLAEAQAKRQALYRPTPTVVVAGQKGI